MRKAVRSRRAPGAGLGLDLRPKHTDLVGRPSRLQLAYHLDPAQRHPEPTQPRHQPGPLQLLWSVEPVTRDRVNARWAQQPELVVKPQRLRRQPRGSGERADGQQVHALASSCRPRRPVTPIMGLSLRRRSSSDPTRCGTEMTRMCPWSLKFGNYHRSCASAWPARRPAFIHRRGSSGWRPGRCCPHRRASSRAIMSSELAHSRGGHVTPMRAPVSRGHD